VSGVEVERGGTTGDAELETYTGSSTQDRSFTVSSARNVEPSASVPDDKSIDGGEPVNDLDSSSAHAAVPVETPSDPDAIPVKKGSYDLAFLDNPEFDPFAPVSVQKLRVSVAPASPKTNSPEKANVTQTAVDAEDASDSCDAPVDVEVLESGGTQPKGNVKLCVVLKLNCGCENCLTNQDSFGSKSFILPNVIFAIEVI
jgi:hypothetical protein